MITKARLLIGSLDTELYDRELKYLQNTVPVTDDDDLYARYIFAMLSPSTKYDMTMKAFDFVMTLSITDRCDKNAVIDMLKQSKTGMHERGRFISEFTMRFWNHPDWFRLMDDETYLECRYRIAKTTNGLWYTKTAFVLEQLYPATCDVVCLDTRILKALGGSGKSLSDPEYLFVEAGWAKICKKLELPSPAVRNVIWNLQGGQLDSRHWMQPFERCAA